MPAGALKTFREGLGSTYFFRARFFAAFFVPFFRPFFRAAMSGYTPCLGPGYLEIPQNLQLEGPHDPSCCDLAAVQPQLRAKLAATANRRQERNSKKIEPMQDKLRILTGARPRPIRPALVREEECLRGKRHQETPQEDAQAQEEEAAEALATQAQVARGRSSSPSVAASRACGLRRLRRRHLVLFYAAPEPDDATEQSVHRVTARQKREDRSPTHPEILELCQHRRVARVDHQPSP